MAIMHQAELKPASRTWAPLGVLVLVILGLAVSRAAESEVRFESGRLWVRTDGDVVARQLLETISEKTGVAFAIDPELAASRIEVEIRGVDLDRAIRRLVGRIPEAGGSVMSYELGHSGEDRLVRVMVFPAGKAPAGSWPEGAGGSTDRVVVTAPVVESPIEAPTPTAEEYESQMQQLISTGIPEETAREFIELTRESVRVQRTPGAAEALMSSERFRAVTRAIARAQGKIPAEEEEPPAH